MSWDWGGAGTGAAGGAMMGSVAGPWGMAAGAVGGGLLGGMMGDELSAQTDPYRFSADSAASRGNMQNLANTNQQWAMTGEGPSNAQALLEKNRADNAARQIGMAKSMPGGDNVLANRQAAEGIAQGDQAASFQGAVLRNQEQQQAMQNAMQGNAAIRQGDIDIYGNRTAVDQENKKNRGGFLSGMLNMGGGMGGLMGGG